MCERGRWRGFHTRYLKTPDGVESPLVVMEQCTECHSYRARNAEGLPYVDPRQEEARQSTDGDSIDIQDPEAEDGGSVWGPDTKESGNDQGW
jgi:hypothetical protein